MKPPRLFNIQHGELMAHGFKARAPFLRSTCGVTQRVVSYYLTISRDLSIEVQFTYLYSDEHIWQQVGSLVAIVYDNMEIPTSACCIEDMKSLYRILTGIELKAKKDGR